MESAKERVEAAFSVAAILWRIPRCGRSMRALRTEIVFRAHGESAVVLKWFSITAVKYVSDVPGLERLIQRKARKVSQFDEIGAKGIPEVSIAKANNHDMTNSLIITESPM